VCVCVCGCVCVCVYVVCVCVCVGGCAWMCVCVQHFILYKKREGNIKVCSFVTTKNL